MRSDPTPHAPNEDLTQARTGTTHRPTPFRPDRLRNPTMPNRPLILYRSTRHRLRPRSDRVENELSPHAPIPKCAPRRRHHAYAADDRASVSPTTGNERALQSTIDQRSRIRKRRVTSTRGCSSHVQRRPTNAATPGRRSPPNSGLADQHTFCCDRSFWADTPRTE